MLAGINVFAKAFEVEEEVPLSFSKTNFLLLAFSEPGIQMIIKSKICMYSGVLNRSIGPNNSIGWKFYTLYYVVITLIIYIITKSWIVFLF